MDENNGFTGFLTLGLGPWMNRDSEHCTETVRTALELGYRHVDTAYRNESSVGDGIVRIDAIDRKWRTSTADWTPW